jgi:hypothetical protein
MVSSAVGYFEGAPVATAVGGENKVPLFGNVDGNQTFCRVNFLMVSH